MVMFLALLTACVGPWPEGQYDLKFDESELKVGFLYSAPIDDGGWAQTHHGGAQELAAAFDAELQFEPAVANIDAPDLIDALVEDGANVIYTTSSGYIEATLDAAGRHPDTFFYSCCGQVSAANTTSYFGRMYQPLYLAGYAAAASSCTGKMGVVAALPNPQFIRHINAFTLGAQRRAREEGRSIEVQVEFVGAFFNPEVEAAITSRHIDAGADVILAQSNSVAPIAERANDTVTCEDQQVPVRRVAYHSPDGCATAGNTENCIGAAHWNWGPLYTNQVTALFEGAFQPDDVAWQPMTDSLDTTVDFRAGGVVTANQGLVSDLSDVRADVTAEPLFPFFGEIRDAGGTVRIANGERLTDAQLDQICWFVDDIEVFDESGNSRPLSEVSAQCAN